MYLKSFTITNYRKFENEDNTVYFVANKKKTEDVIVSAETNDSVETSDEIASEGGVNIASSTTLIVGKNNAGKTTVTKALEKILDEGSKVSGSDFNYKYLNRILGGYISSDEINIYPELSFKLEICVSSLPETIVPNVAPFINIGAIELETIELEVTVKYVIKEFELFKECAERILAKGYDQELLFKKFLELIDKTDFKVKYFGLDGEEVRSNSFRINNLIEMKSISANKNLHTTNLSSVFNKIIRNRYKTESSAAVLEELIDNIDEINRRITGHVTVAHDESVNGVLNEIETSSRLRVKLSSDLSFEKLMNNLIKYEYSEHGLSIPENQFGLGYTNLMNIIGEIIDYVEQYPEGDKQSKINLICIEEPETFMHPQMQESFIKYIDSAVSFLIAGTENKNINSQLVVTTHSSHILNSKIHSSNSFDNINYIATVNNKPKVVRLDDSVVSSSEEYVEGGEESQGDFYTRRLNELKFLKTHIKYKVSELFFSDAIIFVEGVTEETLINYKIESSEELNKFYISIFNINGAHGFVYHPLIKLLEIPTLIITDLDIKRTDSEKESFFQINDLYGRVTTNKTIKKFNCNDDRINNLNDYFTESNLHCVFQKEPINGVYATSFEEALILENYENPILNKVLGEVKPRIYKNIVGDDKDLSKLITSSYELQKKLANTKSDFSNELLYQFIIKQQGEITPELPSYINDGLNWLDQKIQGSLNSEVSL